MGPKPQNPWKSQKAQDDFFSWSEYELAASKIFDGSIITLDVMSNDAGNGSSLYSIDDGPGGNGNFLDDMLENDTTTEWEGTVGGNQIRIVDGMVEFNISNSLIALGGSINGLAAGELLVDTFTYAIELGNGKLSWATVDIQIVGDNDAPVIVSGGGGSSAMAAIDENTTAVMTVAADDPDVKDELLYSISGGADQSQFEIDGSTGDLSFAAAPDFETPGDADADNIYDVQVQVSDGIVADTQDIAVEVKDVAEIPLLAVAYTNNDGIDGFDPVLDTLIAGLYDSNFDAVISAGDEIELGRYPSDLQATTSHMFLAPTRTVVSFESISPTDIVAQVIDPASGDSFDFIWSAGPSAEGFSINEGPVDDITVHAGIIDITTDDPGASPDRMVIEDHPIHDAEVPIALSFMVQPGDDSFIDVDIFV